MLLSKLNIRNLMFSYLKKIKTLTLYAISQKYYEKSQRGNKTE